MPDDATLLDPLHVLDGVEMRGHINTDDETILAHVRHSIRLGYPQLKAQPPQGDRVCLVGGGPSLEATFEELRALYYAGAKVVTVNGAYQWCLSKNIRPSAQIVLDARAENARFVSPAVPNCRYLLASQCHPETWAAVEGRPDVWIWHAMGSDNANRGVLDDFYLQNWYGTPGGTTVVMRALLILRLIGYLRFDLFGVDSCFLGTQHHAYAQPENDVDRPYQVTVSATGRPEDARRFVCATWMIKQLECFLQTVRLHGHLFLLNVHGDGLLAYALKCSADVQIAVGDSVG